MAKHSPAISAGTKRRLGRSAGDLATAATQQMETQYHWYRELPARERSWVSGVAHAGIADFIAWVRDDAPDTTSVFEAAPRELTRSITLAQTLDLVRSVVETVEAHVEELAATEEEVAPFRESVLRYSREVAFGAAHVYAQAAEQRGAWDARLEALVVDAALRGDVDPAIHSRAAALGWQGVQDICVIAGQVPRPAGRDIDVAAIVDGLRRAAARAGHPTLVAVQGADLLCLVGDVQDPAEVGSHLSSHFGRGPVVIGPVVPDLARASVSAVAALSGLRAAPAWPQAPRPCLASDLIAERTIAGDTQARDELLSAIWEPLTQAPTLRETIEVHLREGHGLEATARALFVHVNTVRYRLTKVTSLIGFDPADPHDALTIRLALAHGRLLEGSSNNAP
ncbi:PucR family transcriptional regulator [Janibacter sp. G56]|uniref:PucR family transcriptional regulator n=1 Tax=Janibacter sp. G56 TaxID=3418717 RepID=UPI003D0180FB